jgi:hypothetical protein
MFIIFSAAVKVRAFIAYKINRLTEATDTGLAFLGDARSRKITLQKHFGTDLKDSCSAKLIYCHQ